MLEFTRKSIAYFTITHCCVLINTLFCAKKHALFNNTPETVLIMVQANKKTHFGVCYLTSVSSGTKKSVILTHLFLTVYLS